MCPEAVNLGEVRITEVTGHQVTSAQRIALLDKPAVAHVERQRLRWWHRSLPVCLGTRGCFPVLVRARPIIMQAVLAAKVWSAEAGSEVEVYAPEPGASGSGRAGAGLALEFGSMV